MDNPSVVLDIISEESQHQGFHHLFEASARSHPHTVAIEVLNFSKVTKFASSLWRPPQRRSGRRELAFFRSWIREKEKNRSWIRENNFVRDSWKEKILFANSWKLKNLFVNSWISVYSWFLVREFVNRTPPLGSASLWYIQVDPKHAPPLGGGSGMSWSLSNRSGLKYS